MDLILCCVPLVDLSKQQIHYMQLNAPLIAQLLDKPLQPLSDYCRTIQNSSTWSTDSCFHLTAYKTSFFFKIGKNEVLFSNALPPTFCWWEVLCHLPGMCNASIPPRLPHPGVCQPVGFPRLLIVQGGQLSSFIQLFFFSSSSFALAVTHWSCHWEVF